MAYCEETIGTMHNYASNTSRKSRAICGIKGLPYAAGAAVIGVRDIESGKVRR